MKKEKLFDIALVNCTDAPETFCGTYYNFSPADLEKFVEAVLIEVAPREIELGKSPDGKIYAERDWEKQGDYFMRHMMAGTAENLRRKTDIAAELAHRDILIDALRQMLSHAECIAQERSQAINVLKVELDELKAASEVGKRDVFSWPIGFKHGIILSNGDIRLLALMSGILDSDNDDVDEHIVLWFGETKDDDGTMKFGINYYSEECPEEGSLPLVNIEHPNKVPQSQNGAPAE